MSLGHNSLLARLPRSVRQFIKFGLVGGSGTLVNQIVLILVAKIALWTAGITADDPFVNLLGSQFHIRWYHVFMTIAFLVANTWNYQLNRMWTFKSSSLPTWWRGYIPFLATGLVSFLLTLVVATALMNPKSPIALSDEIFDNSTGFRTKLYWANIISIAVAVPVNFFINKFWAFRKRKFTIIEETVPTVSA